METPWAQGLYEFCSLLYSKRIEWFLTQSRFWIKFGWLTSENKYCYSKLWKPFLETLFWIGVRPKIFDSRKFFSYLMNDLVCLFSIVLLFSHIMSIWDRLHLPEVFMQIICYSYCFLFLGKYLNIFILFLFANIGTLYVTVSFIGREIYGNFGSNMTEPKLYFAQHVINKFLYRS